VLLRGLGVKRAQNATIILGAGASRGASFADRSRRVLPPLDADFFQQAQRLDDGTFDGNVRAVIEFVREEYSPTRLPTLEALFTQLQGFDQFLQQFSTRPGRRPVRYKKQHQYLLELIPIVFRAALEDQRCRWHDRIARSLRKGDAVISFNYDLLIDEAVQRRAGGIWKADRGYGFKVKRGAERWSAGPAPGAFPSKQYLRVLKPHGSLHWTDIDLQNKTLALDEHGYSLPIALGNIIPPTWDKTILGQWPWKPVWEEASRVLQKTRCLIVIGYSVPQTDLTSQALIRSSLSGGALRLLVVANPDPEARSRVIDLARGAVTSRTRIVELQTLSDFGALLDQTPDERRVDQKRQIKLLRRRLDGIEDLTEDLKFHDLDDFSDGITELEGRVSALESLVEE
jgi:hypothetical protein